jgi:hypothetical protein
MSLSEKLVFEKELASDASLREQLEFSRIVDQMIIENEAWNLKAQMQKDLYKPTSRIWPYLAVSLFVLTASVGLFAVFSKKEDKQKVATPAPIASKTTNDEAKPVVLQKSSSPTVTKTATVKEKETSVTVQTTSSEFKVASVEPSMVHNISTPVLTQAVGSSNVASKPTLAVVAKVNPCASLVGDVEFYTTHSCKRWCCSFHI